MKLPKNYFPYVMIKIINRMKTNSWNWSCSPKLLWYLKMFLLQTPKRVYRLNRVVDISWPQSVFSLASCSAALKATVHYYYWPGKHTGPDWHHEDIHVQQHSQANKHTCVFAYANKKRKYCTMSTSSFPYKVQLECLEQNSRVKYDLNPSQGWQNQEK